MGSLGERWAQGCHNARRLAQELVQRGDKGAARMVRQGLQPWRARPEAGPSILTPAQRIRLLLPPATRVSAAERDPLACLLRAHPVLAHGSARKSRVQALLAPREGAAVDPWLPEAEIADLPAFQTVARSFRRDDAALIAALTAPWSTGQGEGQSCRVKLLTRLGDGRAKVDLLAQRIRHRRVAAMVCAGEKGQIEHQVAAYGHTATNVPRTPGRPIRPTA
jgi:transposase